MATDLFSRSHLMFLRNLSSPRIRYDATTGRLQLYVSRACELPPAWIRALRVEVVGDRVEALVALDLVWDELDDSLMTASCVCPETFRPLCTSEDFVPIGEVIFSAGNESRRLPNGSSSARFAARQPSRDPDEDCF